MLLHGVTVGQDHACALDPSGNAFCWGHGQWNQVGQTAIGSAPPVAAPTPVAVLTSVQFRALAAGDQHTCGIGTDNHIYCWGRDEFGQLGIGFAQNIPTAVSQAVDPS
jgi:alpha-tubulin suppressor-like RCC1 family protein